MAAPALELQFPEKLGGLFEPHRYKVMHGGRGGMKSWSAARALILEGYRRPLRVLCARELQLSIADSVHKLIADQIAALGLGRAFEVQRQGIYGPRGTEFLFSGIRSNVNKIKSMEGVDVAWVEEAEAVSADSWEVLIPTIRKPGSEIWVTFNPQEETDPTYQRFVVNPPPDAWVREVGWEDNPWLPDELRKEKDWLYKVDPEAAEHVWGGKPRNRSDAQVLRGRWRVEPFEPLPHWDGPYLGADWGFAVDPTTLVKVWVDTAELTLYVEHEAWGLGVEFENIPALFDTVPGSRDHVIRADSARPETINYVQRHGFPRLIGAEKGPGSVEDGVEHLRGYRAIVIHPRCVHTKDEARNWSYKVDRLTKAVKPELEDKWNHCWDAIRYALEPIIKTMPGQGFFEWARREAMALEAAKRAEAERMIRAKP